MGANLRCGCGRGVSDSGPSVTFARPDRPNVSYNLVTITLTAAHHAKLSRAKERLTRALQRLTRDDEVKVTRADVFALLIENYADVVVLPPGKD